MILTNHPERMHEALGLGNRWLRIAASELAEPDRAVWTALSQTRDPWYQDMPGAFWRSLFLIDEAPRSQFEAVRELLSAPGLPRGVRSGAFGMLALSGEGFRGQRGRAWAAERGNLHFCAVLTPRAPVGELALSLTMLPAVAVADAISSVSKGRLRPVVKWVNDVLLDGRKVAGVLTATQSRGDELESALFGIGINVSRAPEVTPTPFVPTVGCLNGWGAADGVPLARVVRGVTDAIERRYTQLLEGGPEALFHAYMSAAGDTIGRNVRIYPEGLEDTAPASRWPAPDAVGVLRTIHPDLALTLDGHPEPVTKGRLAFEEACRAFGLPPLT